MSTMKDFRTCDPGRRYEEYEAEGCPSIAQGISDQAHLLLLLTSFLAVTNPTHPRRQKKVNLMSFDFWLLCNFIWQFQCIELIQFVMQSLHSAVYLKWVIPIQEYKSKNYYARVGLWYLFVSLTEILFSSSGTDQWPPLPLCRSSPYLIKRADIKNPEYCYCNIIPFEIHLLIILVSHPCRVSPQQSQHRVRTVKKLKLIFFVTVQQLDGRGWGGGAGQSPSTKVWIISQFFFHLMNFFCKAFLKLNCDPLLWRLNG